jgi:hypothetical protein
MLTQSSIQTMTHLFIPALAGRGRWTSWRGFPLQLLELLPKNPTIKSADKLLNEQN